MEWKKRLNGKTLGSILTDEVEVLDKNSWCEEDYEEVMESLREEELFVENTITVGDLTFVCSGFFGSYI